ncbi:lysyl oxidase homolog 2b isoform X2 [Syngnathoides biaculeatus]|uniref:lysyl oxidase homolog 2b isoform X2 n=1 Tax=Syngnathoides biaculeatus TaxID=300417 RepID=UPI002ADDCEF0|nr:lysyl oxidase homolog 2b isoform X2 [Syngnathoides biaculeatus]
MSNSATHQATQSQSKSSTLLPSSLPTRPGFSSGWQGTRESTMRVVLRFSTTANGELSVMTTSPSTLHRWCAGSWAMWKQFPGHHHQNMGKEKDPSGLTIFIVLAKKRLWRCVPPMGLVFRTVSTVKMWEWCAATRGSLDLNFSTFFPITWRMFARRRKPTYWEFSVNCTGNEAHFSSCKLGRDESNGTCAGGLPVVVSCVPGRAFAPSATTGFRKAFKQEQPLVRVRGGAIIGEGRVEVLKNGEWGTICDDNWNLQSATVVCRELGFGTAKEALSGGRLGQGMGPVHMNEVECSGFEKSITECSFNKESVGCSHEEDAAVRCNVPAMGFQERLRLSGGRNPFEGRVEVLVEKNGSLVWGTVCSEGWGTMEAMVVCRQLGLGFASNVFQETWYWQGEMTADSVVMSGVRCSGTEMSLSHCLHHGAHLSCSKGGGRNVAGVSCSETAPDLVLNPQVVEQTTYMEDRPMFMLQCAFEEECLSSSSKETPANSYRRLLRFSSQIHNNGQSDFRPKASRHAWVWHDCHRHYHSMEVFTIYDLFSLNGTKVAEGHKASFCLEDSECDEGIEKVYECDNFGEQGITVGCWDTYRHDIDCQWIDITDIKPGDYIFQIIINPNYEVPESDYTNNIMKCRCRYDGHRVWMYSCHNGGSLSTETEQTFPGLLNNQVTHR